MTAFALNSSVNTLLILRFAIELSIRTFAHIWVSAKSDQVYLVDIDPQVDENVYIQTNKKRVNKVTKRNSKKGDQA